MPTERIPFGDGHAVLTHQDGWKPGDQPPPDHDYLGWHAWAEVQHKAGLRQRQCGRCGRWKYPQELSDKETVSYAQTRRGQKVKMVSPICRNCHDIQPSTGAK